MQQIAKALHLRVHAIDDLFLVAKLVEPLNEHLPVDELVDGEVAEVQQQIDFFGGEGDIQQTEGMLELQIGHNSLLISIGLLKGLLQSLGARAQNILHALDDFAALGLNNVLIGVNMLQ